MSSSNLISTQRIRNSQQSGNQSEHEWAPNFFESFGWQYQPSSREENLKQHFDFWISRFGQDLKIEVKAPKRCWNRNHEGLELILCEHTGIAGFRGWIFGEADFILQFIDCKTALVYQRESLVDKLPEPEGIKRYESNQAPIGEWFGRVGMSRNGYPNQDIIRWDLLDWYLQNTWSSLYQIKENKWIQI
jgi:hypothetical protein